MRKAPKNQWFKPGDMARYMSGQDVKPSFIRDGKYPTNAKKTGPQKVGGLMVDKVALLDSRGKIIHSIPASLVHGKTLVGLAQKPQVEPTTKEIKEDNLLEKKRIIKVQMEALGLREMMIDGKLVWTERASAEFPKKQRPTFGEIENLKPVK